MQSKLRLAIIFLSILIPLGLALFVRLNDVPMWHKNKRTFYFGNRPLFSSYDAFLFARYGKEFFNGKYKTGKPDTLRFVPDSVINGTPSYPIPVPMSSFLAGLIAKLKKTHIENVDMYFTPVLASLFVIPFVLYFWIIGLPATGFLGASLGSISLIYLVRTSVLRFDTDSLNLCLPFAFGLFLLLALKSSGKKRLTWLLLAGVFAQLYYWWYSHPGIILLYIFLFLTSAFWTEREKPAKEHLKLALLTVLFFNPWVVYLGIFGLIGKIKTYLLNYFKPAVGAGFPNIFMSISEQKHFNLKTTATLTCGSVLLFAPGFAGTLMIIWKRFKDTLFLLPMFLIGLMALKGGNRFGMYLAPFIGAGIGYLLEGTVELIKKEEKIKNFIKIGGCVVLLALSISLNKESFRYVSTPRLSPGMALDFLIINRITPKNAWIWTWWDYGYAIEYIAERATFHDGGSQGSPKTYFIATSFSTSNPEIAHNVIKAIAHMGVTGIMEKVKEGTEPEKLRNEIFSGKYSQKMKNPVYWLFTEDLIGKFTWINYFGTWDFKAKKGLRNGILRLSGCSIKGKGTLFVCSIGVFNIKTGIWARTDGRKIPIKAFVIKDKKRIVVQKKHPNGVYLEAINTPRGLMLLLMTEQPYRSMFNQMYLLRNYDKRFFELVYDNFPLSVLYRVKD